MTAMIAALIAATAAALAAPGRGPAQGIPHPSRTAIVTAYCSACSGSIGCRDNRLRVGDCAADPRWHKYGERIWIEGFGVLTVRDTGGDIKGRDRFDVYLGSVRHCRCGERVGRARRKAKAVMSDE